MKSGINNHKETFTESQRQKKDFPSPYSLLQKSILCSLQPFEIFYTKSVTAM